MSHGRAKSDKNLQVNKHLMRRDILENVLTFNTMTFRPVLSRGQTIEADSHSCCSQCSDDLVTVLEMVSKKVISKEKD